MLKANVERLYGDFIATRTYCRWLDKEGRRERWPEPVERYRKFFGALVPDIEAMRNDFNQACDAIVDMKVMPSMRALWTAGEALAREHIAGYNCAALIMDNPKAFAEMLYILMNGTGVGFSVERQFIAKLPEVPIDIHEGGESSVIVFRDSKLGWAEGYHAYVRGLYSGLNRKVDLSKIRPAGARLKTFGGRASGPGPLKQLIDYTYQVFNGARGRKLNSIEVYDICCMIANCVVVGGVRRSAGISFSNLSDERMRNAKQGEFWHKHGHRALTNNSVAYTEKPEADRFLEEWLALIRSESGERGIVNRESFRVSAEKNGRDTTYEFLCNPCGEIILRPMEFCNLTEVVVRPGDSLPELETKVMQATLLGVLQSTLTDFGFLREEWRRNCEEERLLGVSLTGVCDHPILSKTSGDAPIWLRKMRKVARDTANEWADALGINRPKAITCVKPSGTVSQLVDSSSGLHPRWSEYYIRRVRVSASDPVCRLLMDAGVPNYPEVGQTEGDCTTRVFEFPIKSPDNCVVKDDMSAIDQLETWLMYKREWCDHNPSVTIYVRPSEWFDVGAWVYRNWDMVGGLSFLPANGGNYPLAPYEAIDKAKYDKLVDDFPLGIDFARLVEYEREDATIGSREMTCAGGVCELA